MLSSCIIGLSAGLFTGTTVYVKNLYRQDKLLLQSFMDGKPDKLNGIYLSKNKIQGSQHVFSLSATNAIYNNLSIYQDKYDETTDINPVFTNRGMGFSVGTKLEKTSSKIFNKVYKANEIKCGHDCVDLNTTHFVFDPNNTIRRQLTLGDFNKLANEIGSSSLPLNLNHCKEKFIIDGADVFCVIKNDTKIEAIIHDVGDLKKYMKKYYKWSEGGFALFIVIVLGIVAAAIIIATLDNLFYDVLD